MIAGQLLDGHILLADWMFLIAAAVALVATIATYVRQTPPRDVVPCMIPLAITLLAVGWLVL